MTRRAIILIGPTGSGKTPLGNLLAQRGIAGLPAAHLDFGSCLRAVASGTESFGLTEEDARLVRTILDTGALLENDTFYLAERIVDGFLADQEADAIVVFNGLPRHVDQARHVVRWCTVVAVVHLACTPDVVWARLQSNIGQDRGERTDDTRALVDHKLRTYEERTVPLLRYFSERAIPIISCDVTAHTTPDDAYTAVSEALRPVIAP